MLRIGNYTINSDINTIVEKLIEEGLLKGKHRDRGQYVTICCPFHDENRPSSSITTVDIQKGDRVVEAGTFHCFGCGATGNLFETISQCLGKRDAGVSGIEWLRKNFGMEEESKVIKFFKPYNPKPLPQRPRVPERVLDEFRYFHDYMYERKMTDEAIDYFDIGYDRDEQCITMPVRHPYNGKVVFCQTRSVRGKFHKYPEFIIKTDYIFGYYEAVQEIRELKSEGKKDIVVWVCESIINAITLWTDGKIAVALMGTGGGNQYRLLNGLFSEGLEDIVFALDPDEAGDKGTERLIKQITSIPNRFIVEYPQYVRDKELDINSMDDEDRINLDYVLVN